MIHKPNRLLTALFLLTASQLQAQDIADTLFIYRKSGGFDAFPMALVQSSQEDSRQLTIVTTGGDTFTYSQSEIERTSHQAPALPDARLLTYKFNNKYNDQLHVDAEGDIVDDSVVNVQLAGIGSWLTPSFTVSDSQCQLYIADERQVSKTTRRPMKTDTYYTLARPDDKVYGIKVLKETIYGPPEGEYIAKQIDLEPDMLSTNAPSNNDEGLDKMLDGDPGTFYHSTWGNGVYQPLPEGECPYFDIALKQPLRLIRIGYTTRADVDRTPKTIEIWGSNDGVNWVNRATLSTKSGLPDKMGETFMSGNINMLSEFSYLRFRMTESSYKNYFCLAEFSLYQVEKTLDPNKPTIIQQGDSAYVMKAYGKPYRVHLDWQNGNGRHVPTIRLTTDNGQMISSKDYYLDGTIQIDGQGFGDLQQMPVQMKGRGNTSWSNNPWDKNPYRLKFASKQKPLGMTNGKNWVLQANRQTHSMMTNAVGMKIARLMKVPGGNHYTPVDLYINGNYRGSYTITEKVGLSNNSIDLEDESKAALMELDIYTNDGDPMFTSSYYNVPVKVKDPDFSEDATVITLNDIRNDFNKMMRAVYTGSQIEQYVNIDTLARFLMVNDLILNYELHHPKSTYLYKEDFTDPNSRFVFGPVWDLDWAYGYEKRGDYCLSETQSDFYRGVNMEHSDFLYDLRHKAGEVLDRAYYKVWTEFMDHHLQEVIDFCDDYYLYANASFEQNATVWGDGSDYKSVASRMKSWLSARAQYVYDNLTPYDLVDDDDDDDETSGIHSLPVGTPGAGTADTCVDVYDLRGVLVRRHVPLMQLRQTLPAGIYIVNGRKLKI